ncbi:MAG: GIY-YIG nuclease family protein [Chloroflexaceae bacterium]|nr:GIY-YIG nuclease family protein [Chloroflexaceae bacterium]
MRVKTNSGTYLLILQMEPPCHQIRIGQLGTYDLEAGFYLYVGSAFGPGGLDARLNHHRQRNKARPHWHIDYLRPHCQLVAIWTVACEQRLETIWCDALMYMPTISIPIPGFGASDSDKPSHLFYSDSMPSIRLMSHIFFSTNVMHDPAIDRLVIDILPGEPDRAC